MDDLSVVISLLCCFLFLVVECLALRQPELSIPHPKIIEDLYQILEYRFHHRRPQKEGSRKPISKINQRHRPNS